MNDHEVRELVRIRWELRQLMAKDGRADVAAPLIDRMADLAMREPAVGGEACRWRSLFRLDGLAKFEPGI